ncbi:MAG: GNAT family N-acetyltransferase [Cyanobacteria bacterium P01_C01_bin.72]
MTVNIHGDIKTKTVEARGIRFSIIERDREIVRAYLYIMHNELHQEPFSLLEDVYVEQNYRGSGLGTRLVKRIIDAARQNNCYKLIY